MIQNESDNFIRGQFQFYDYETKLFDEIFSIFPTEFKWNAPQSEHVSNNLLH